MAGVNKVILLGNLGSDPEVRHLEGGSVVARFNIATSEAYTSRTGERVEQTEWHRIELWDNLAKIAEQYLRKGNQVYIEGKIKSESWKDKDGVEKTGIRIRATSMTLVGGRPNAGDGSDNTYDSPAAQAPQQAQPATAPRPQAAPAPQPAPRQQTARREPDPVFEPSGDDDLPF
ncbi:single-stranded DNA-binding protein [Spirosoma luteolum]